MKKIYLIFLGLTTVSTFSAQTIVSTSSGDKHVIFEEFSGVGCSSCPGGHTIIANITAANPGKVHVVSYAPANSGYTHPGFGGTDFRRSFADAFFTGTYCSPLSGSKFMPSAFINRKLIGGDILKSIGSWTSHVNSTLTETADLNVGMKSTYDAINLELVIDIEVYYLSNITTSNSLYVLITEDDLTSPHQLGSSATAANPYVYKHIFRENVTSGQWGDAISGPTTQGSTYTTQLTFDLSNSIDPINIAKAHIVAFVVDGTSSNKKVYNGISVSADGGLASTGDGTVNVHEFINEDHLSIYPNPTSSISVVYFNLVKDTDVRMDVYNTVGSLVYSKKNRNMTAGNQKIIFDGTALPQGMYFINLIAGDQKITKKLSFQK